MPFGPVHAGMRSDRSCQIGKSDTCRRNEAPPVRPNRTGPCLCAGRRRGPQERTWSFLNGRGFARQELSMGEPLSQRYKNHANHNRKGRGSSPLRRLLRKAGPRDRTAPSFQGITMLLLRRPTFSGRPGCRPANCPAPPDGPPWRCRKKSCSSAVRWPGRAA